MTVRKTRLRTLATDHFLFSFTLFIFYLVSLALIPITCTNVYTHACNQPQHLPLPLVTTRLASVRCFHLCTSLYIKTQPYYNEVQKIQHVHAVQSNSKQIEDACEQYTRSRASGLLHGLECSTTRGSHEQVPSQGECHRETCSVQDPFSRS